MPRIRCHYVDCTFNDDLYCSAAAVEIDPETGCATFSIVDRGVDGKISLEDEELEEIDEETDEDDDLWSEDEDEDEEEY